eukprot:364701-Chlamydomonas_euryale.AAC.3
MCGDCTHVQTLHTLSPVHAPSPAVQQQRAPSGMPAAAVHAAACSAAAAVDSAASAAAAAAAAPAAAAAVPAKAARCRPRRQPCHHCRGCSLRRPQLSRSGALPHLPARPQHLSAVYAAATLASRAARYGPNRPIEAVCNGHAVATVGAALQLPQAAYVQQSVRPWLHIRSQGAR